METGYHGKGFRLNPGTGLVNPNRRLLREGSRNLESVVPHATNPKIHLKSPAMSTRVIQAIAARQVAPPSKTFFLLRMTSGCLLDPVTPIADSADGPFSLLKNLNQEEKWNY